jgi:general secretion pathway protein F
MATILERGRTIAPALVAYADELPAGRQRRQLLAVCRVLASGDAAAATAALAELPECWIPLLSAATSSTDPGHVLREFLSESRRTDELRHQWWLTLAYPILLVCLAAVVLVALSIFIIPEFRAIFIEFDMALPPITLFVLAVASWLSSWGLLIIAALIAALVVLFLKAIRLLPATMFAWLGDRFRPPFGRRTAVARFAHFTADLLEAGVSMPDALRIAGFTVSPSRLQRAAWGLASDLEATGGCSVRAYQRPLTATVLHALTAEMSPATRVRLLREISACHAERVRIGLSWSSGIVEPFAICLVGFWVGLVVLALFIPLVKLVEGLSG